LGKRDNFTDVVNWFLIWVWKCKFTDLKTFCSPNRVAGKCKYFDKNILSQEAHSPWHEQHHADFCE